MKPLGVHVTIVEPGGFRTDFAASSTRIAEGSPAYAETVGQVAAMQRAYDGKQLGDPERAARAMMTVVSAKAPPLRLVLGSDAYARAEAGDEARLAELRAWRELTSRPPSNLDARSPPQMPRSHDHRNAAAMPRTAPP